MSIFKEEPLPCPLCGTEMHQHQHCFSHPYPKGRKCVLTQYSFDNEKIKIWNQRG